MKRSQVNAIIAEARDVMRRHSFHLPQFAGWDLARWQAEAASGSVDEIVDAQLGWDITDFARGDFNKFGLVLFTVRNGVPASTAGGRVLHGGKTYCEKVMVARAGQMTPMHFHWHKMEDIICRAGAPLVLQLFNADRATEDLDRAAPVTVAIDGVKRTVPAGAEVVLQPGESITLPPYLYHRFWAQPNDANEPCLIGEVSLVNDDDNDNRFAEPLGRFPTVDEDVAPTLLITKDYKRLLGDVGAK